MVKNVGSNKWFLFLLILSALFIPSFSLADVLPEEGRPFSVNLKSKHTFDTDVNAQSGQINITESFFNAAYDKKIGGKLPITLSIDYRHTDIENGVPVDLPSHLEGPSLGLSTKFPIPFVDIANYYLGIDIRPSMYTDDGRWESSAFRMPSRVYVIYKPREELIFVAGVWIRTGYDETVLPVFGLIYKPNDRLSFNLASDNPNISYKLNDQTDVFVEFDSTWDEYEVTRGTQKGVVLKYRSSSTGLGVRHELMKNVQAELSGGLVFNRKIAYRDDVGKVEPDAGGYAEAKLSAKF